jgi:hypothetical protein
MGADVPWVQPVLAVPLGFTEGAACGGKVWLAHQDDLTERLAPERSPKRLNKRQVERTVAVLDDPERHGQSIPTPAGRRATGLATPDRRQFPRRHRARQCLRPGYGEDGKNL